MEFAWDSEKDRANRNKHGIAFSAVVAVFDAGDAALEVYDAVHSLAQERFITIGPVGSRIVVVSWTEQPPGVIRIISARHTTPRERRLYHRHLEDLL